MEMSLRDHLRLLVRKLWLIALIVIVCCVTAGIYSVYYVEPVYEASSQMLINKSAEQMAAGSSGNANTPTLDYNEVNTNIALVATYKVVLSSTYIMQKVIDQHPEFRLSPEELQGKVKVNSVTNTQVITLIVSDHDYGQAVKISKAVSEVFQNEVLNVMKVDNVVILNTPTENRDPAPVKPNLKMNVSVAFLLSLLAGVALSYVLAFFDRTLKREEDVVSYLGIPLLAYTPKIKPIKQASIAVQRQKGETTNAPATSG